MHFRLIISVAFFFYLSHLYSQQITWEQVSTPVGGEVYTLVSDSRGNIYAGTFGGAFVSKNKGESWERIKGIDVSINSIISHSSGSIILSGSNYIFFVDGDMNVTKRTGQISCLSKSTKEIIYGLQYQVIMFSSDGGRNWKTRGVPNFEIYSMTQLSDNEFCAVTKNGIIYSSDTCKTWKSYSFNYPTPTSAYEGTLRKDSAGNIYLKLFTEIYKSTDKGQSWNQLKFPYNENVRNFHSLHINSSNEIYTGTSDGVWLSKDEGKTWVNIYKTWERVSNFIETSNSEILFSTWSKGVLKLNNATNIVEQKNNGLFATKFFNINFFDEYLLGLSSENISYKYVSDNWNVIQSPININSNFFINNNKLILPKEQQIFYSSFPFVNWSKIELPKNYYFYFGGVAISNKTAIVLVENYTYNGTTSSFLLRTTDLGKSWETIFSVSGYTYTTFHVTIDNEIFIGLNKTLYNSKDFGKTWSVFNEFSSQINSIAQRPNTEVFVGTSEGLFVKRNSTWKKLPFPLNSQNVRQIQFINTGELFVLGHGLFVSRDFGNSFSELYNNYNEPVQRLAISNSGKILISTEERGLLKANYNASQVSFDGSNLLFNNYPNPFNGSTAIRFSLQNVGRVSIKVFNSLGEEVEEIANKEFGIGANRVFWQPNNLPSGVYFYRIQTPNYSETKKMIYLK